MNPTIAQIFGTETNKDLLISFLNSLFVGKEEGELATLFDKWLYVMKNLSRLKTSRKVTHKAWKRAWSKVVRKARR